MKEATGSTFMIYVLLIFLAVYITFVAVALNYAKAFRVKNSVIDIIEQNEGMTDDELSNINTTGNTISQIKSKLNDYNYRTKISLDSREYIGYTCYEDPGTYCIAKENDTTSGREYYKVVTFLQINISFLNLSLPPIPIRGETRVIERINA